MPALQDASGHVVDSHALRHTLIRDEREALEKPPSLRSDRKMAARPSRRSQQPLRAQRGAGPTSPCPREPYASHSYPPPTGRAKGTGTTGDPRDAARGDPVLVPRLALDGEFCGVPMDAGGLRPESPPNPKSPRTISEDAGFQGLVWTTLGGTRIQDLRFGKPPLHPAELRALDSTIQRVCGRPVKRAGPATRRARHTSTSSGTRWMSLRPLLGNGRGIGWAWPAASMVRQRRS